MTLVTQRLFEYGIPQCAEGDLGGQEVGRTFSSTMVSYYTGRSRTGPRRQPQIRHHLLLLYQSLDQLVAQWGREGKQA